MLPTSKGLHRRSRHLNGHPAGWKGPQGHNLNVVRLISDRSVLHVTTIAQQRLPIKPFRPDHQVKVVNEGVHSRGIPWVIRPHQGNGQWSPGGSDAKLMNVPSRNWHSVQHGKLLRGVGVVWQKQGLA